ncbi:unnamed protein product [Clonostachys rosea f. rosea IK726]|jgi:ankyrin repeat protein|uniref:Uncharacterized protein n=2 Tax=Bionectria ochroleuca TaxID=29856 RepID=A0A0B7JS81_BIOOC|nr:unnamed protein product [Clonostachys rosea f. rosea IK726]
MPLSALPTELLQAISENLASLTDVSALARTNWHMFHVLISQLYRRNHDLSNKSPYHVRNRSKSAVVWAIQRHKPETIRRAVTVGVDLVQLHHIMLAIKRGQYDIFQTLWACKLEYGGFENLDQDEAGARPIVVAAKSGSVEIVRALVETGKVDLEAGGDMWTPLLVACQDGNHQMVKLLLEHGANIRNPRTQQAALTVAASRHQPGRQVTQKRERGRTSYLETIRVLFQHGAQLEYKEANGKTALHTAALEGFCDVVDLLASLGAEVNTRDGHGNTPLISTSLKLGRADMTQLLLRIGADINAKNERGNSPLSMTRDTAEPVAVAKVLLDNGAMITADVEGNTPLHLSGHIGSLELAELLLEHGADVHALNRQNQTPLHCAAEEKDAAKIVRLLVDKGASLTAAARGGETPLGCAIPHQSLDIIQFLLEKGSDANAVTKSGSSGLQHAIRSRAIELTELLLQHGADLGTFNYNGQGALHFVSMVGNTQLMDMFIRYGVPVNSRDSQGRTPLMCALEGATGVNVDILLENGASVNEKDDLLQTALHKAARRGMVKAARTLLENGADANAKDKNNQTPLHIAKISRRPKMVEILLDHGAECSIAGCCEGNTVLDTATISPGEVWVYGAYRSW